MQGMTQWFTGLIARVRRNGWRTLALSLLAVVGIAVVAACTSSGGSGQATDSAAQQSSYDRLVAEAPAQQMTNPVTRNTINFWIQTWNKPGALSYVYLQNANGDITGYFVLKGLPVSYCTSLTPNYKIIQDQNDNGQMAVPAPGMDGVYYSGGDCARYYGRDATTNAYVEFTTGNGQNMLLYSQPLPGHPNVPPLGPSKIVDGHLQK